MGGALIRASCAGLGSGGGVGRALVLPGGANASARGEKDGESEGRTGGWERGTAVCQGSNPGRRRRRWLWRGPVRRAGCPGTAL